MGFFDKLGSAIVNTAKESSKQGLVNGILSASKGSYANTLGSLSESNWHKVTISTLDMSNAAVVKTKDVTSVKKLDNSSALVGYASSVAKQISTELDDKNIPNNSGYHLKDTVQVPDWGYDMFINERTSFQKGLGGPTNDPGYFYFKIFFNFNTNYGLFGGILNSDDPYSGSVNTAIKYMYMCRNSYKQERMLDRINALIKFTKILSFINSQSPWFFKGVHGLDKANVPIMNEFSKEKSIEIECLEDAIDMRLSTLLELYKYAAYDDYFSKEIIPDNLRKFDMSIMLYAAPIKYFHTAIKHSASTLNYKGFNASQDYGNMPSFKLYTFMNCEIDLESLGAMIPSSMTNESPFQLGKSRIKIKYDKVVTHTMNEFNRILFGTTGIYYDEYYRFQDEAGKFSISGARDSQSRRYEALSNAADVSAQSHFDKTKNKYKALVDAAESFSHINLMKLTGYSLGNLYGYDTKIGSDYWKTKMNWQFNKNISIIQDIGTNVLLKLLNSSYNASARLHTSGSGIKISDDGWLPGYGQTAVGSQYWLDKVQSLKSGKKQTSGYTDYVEQKQRADRFDFGQTLYDMFRN